MSLLSVGLLCGAVDGDTAFALLLLTVRVEVESDGICCGARDGDAAFALTPLTVRVEGESEGARFRGALKVARCPDLWLPVRGPGSFPGGGLVGNTLYTDPGQMSGAGFRVDVFGHHVGGVIATREALQRQVPRLYSFLKPQILHINVPHLAVTTPPANPLGGGAIGEEPDLQGHVQIQAQRFESYGHASCLHQSIVLSLTRRQCYNRLRGGPTLHAVAADHCTASVRAPPGLPTSGIVSVRKHVQGHRGILLIKSDHSPGMSL